MEIFLFLTIHWFASLFFQTFFHHRYAAHRMFSMSNFWEKTFFILTFIFQGASYLKPSAYAIMHRQHHAFSDTENDPHSPHFTGNLMKMMVRTGVIYHDLVRSTREEPKPPEWEPFDRFADSMYVRILWGTLYTTFYFHYMTNFWVLFLLPIHYLMGPIHGAIVNWCGHKYGYRNFDNGDKSRNTLVVDLLLMGELYQNNHHKFPNRANFSFRWFEFDPAYPIVRLLNLLRIIRLTPLSA